jgi:hypothetical protein
MDIRKHIHGDHAEFEEVLHEPTASSAVKKIIHEMMAEDKESLKELRGKKVEVIPMRKEAQPDMPKQTKEDGIRFKQLAATADINPTEKETTGDMQKESQFMRDVVAAVKDKLRAA